MARLHGSRWSATSLVLVLGVIFGLVATCSALYEAEIGKDDWRYQNIGKVTHVVAQTTPLRKRFYMATEQGAIAALAQTLPASPGSELVWRRVLPEDESVQGLSFDGRGFLLALGKRTAWVFDTDGNLVVEKSAHVLEDGSGVGPVVKAQFGKAGGEKTTVAIVADQSLSLFSQDGKLLKEVSLPEGFVATALASSEAEVLVASRSSVLKVPISSGEIVSLPVGPSAFPEQAAMEFVDSDLIAIDSMTATTYVAKVGSAQEIRWSSQALALPKSPISALTAVSGGLISIRFNNGEAILLSLQDATLGVVSQWAKTEAMSVTSTADKKVIVSQVTEAKPEVIEVKAVDSKGKLGETLHQLPIGKSPVQSVFVTIDQGKDASVQVVKALVQRADWTLESLVKGRTEWSRAEALSVVKHSLIVEIPAPTQTHVGTDSLPVPSFASSSYFASNTAKDSRFFSQFASRLIGELEDLLAFINTAIHNPESFVEDTKEWLNLGAHHHWAGEALQGDRYGLKQLVLVVTEPGTIIALHTNGGAVVWQRHLPLASNTKKFVLLRRAVSGTPEVALIAQPSPSETVVVSLNALTGEVLSTETLSVDTELAIALPQVDAYGRHPIILVDSNHKAHVVGKSAAVAIAHQSAGKTFFYLINQSLGLVTGYKLVPSKQAEATISPVEIWSTSLGAPIDAFVHGVVNTKTPGRVLGDKSVLYKYLNPNTLVIGGVKQVSASGTQLSVAVVDTITGGLVWRTTHKDAQGPLFITQAENWAVYTFWNTKTHRFEASVVELFINNADWKGDVFSSYDISPSSINALQQTYVLPYAVRSLVSTITAQGITEKSVLFGLENGQVLALSRKYLDPRRPATTTPTEDQRNEGLVPYTSTLYAHPIQYINYNQTVENIRGIAVSPAHLESTSLVFVYGLDIFYAPVVPNYKYYDRLSHDFNRWIITAAVALFLVAAFIAQRIAKGKELKRAWK